MSGSEILDVPFVHSVFHPSDFSPESENAFAHALAIALIRRTELAILHAGRDFLAEDEWTRFPSVRATLERWGLLEEGSPRSAIFDALAVRVKKVNLKSLSPLAAALDYLERHLTDLMVLATEGRDGLPRWIRPSLAERLARRSATKTLFVPNSARGFVSLEDGDLRMRRILVPVDHQPNPQAAMAYALRATALSGGAPVEILLLHVGDGERMPEVEVPEVASCAWERLQRRGDAVEEIVRVARDRDVDLIAMATEGHEGILDALRGSVTEQVVRRAPCAVLAVPADAIDDEI
ncbi:universal stress protein [bacterium]|nr:universal stress protein [bacterium]